MVPQTELHRHLDASLRPKTLWELALKKGLLSQSTSYESFRESFILDQPFTDLKAVLSQFELFQKVQDRPEILERVAFEAVEDCVHEGTQRIEYRFSPGFVCEKNALSWEEALSSYERGIEKAKSKYDIQVGLICIASRDYGADSASETVEFFLKHRNRFIGLDLAGNEREFPCKIFEEAFRPARQAGAKITVHAGEASGPENVWEAIELLGASRIGHGIHSIEDPELVQYLSEKEICLEICPTSNWITQAVKNLKDHPLPLFLRAGVPVSINTDDPGIFGKSLPDELKICQDVLGLTSNEIQTCLTHANQKSFLS